MHVDAQEKQYIQQLMQWEAQVMGNLRQSEVDAIAKAGSPNPDADTDSSDDSSASTIASAPVPMQDQAQGQGFNMAEAKQSLLSDSGIRA